MSVNLTGNHFINRDAIESKNNVILPKFYDTRVIQILENVKASLPGNEAYAKGIRESREASGSKTSSFFSWPSIINIGSNNTTHNNASWGSSINNSTTSYVASVEVPTEPNRTLTKEQQESQKKAEQDKADQQNRQIIGLVAAGVVGISTYLIGKTLGNMSNTLSDGEEIVELKTFTDETKTQLSQLKNSHSTHEAAALEKQIKKLDEINNSPYHKRVKRNQKIDLVLRVSLFASSLIALVGAVVAVKPLMATGGITAGITFCGWLLKKGIEAGESRKFNQIVKKLNDNIDIILNCLNQLPTQNMSAVASLKTIPQWTSQGQNYYHPVYWAASAPPDSDMEFPLI